MHAELKARDLRRMLDRCVRILDQKSLPELQAVWLHERGGQLIAVATDRYRICWTRPTDDHEVEGGFTACLSWGVAKELIRSWTSKTPETVHLTVEDSGDLKVLSSGIERKVPTVTPGVLARMDRFMDVTTCESRAMVLTGSLLAPLAGTGTQARATSIWHTSRNRLVYAIGNGELGLINGRKEHPAKSEDPATAWAGIFPNLNLEN